jgi:thymidylate synthase (FAD)
MKIVEASFDLIVPHNREHGVDMLRLIESFARISHRSEEKQTGDSWEPFIKAVVLGHGDWSVVEHQSASVIFRVNRGVTHELVRHRLFSFTQESTRFVNGRKSYPEGLEFITPLIPDQPASIAVRDALVTAEDSYLKLLDRGIRPQEARAVLPNALAATIAVTGNLRNWRHFLIMRTSRETHPDFKQVTLPLLRTFKERIPLLFDDIVEEERQIDAMRKPR